MVAQERSAGVIIYRREGADIRFLVLFKKYKGTYWDLVKGHYETGETARDTAIREAKEEAGIDDLQFINGFKQKVVWLYRKDGRLTRKAVTYFLAETKTTAVKISREHLKPAWFTLAEAERVIKLKDTKKLLRKADVFLRKQAAKR